MTSVCRSSRKTTEYTMSKSIISTGGRVFQSFLCQLTSALTESNAKIVRDFLCGVLFSDNLVLTHVNAFLNLGSLSGSSQDRTDTVVRKLLASKRNPDLLQEIILSKKFDIIFTELPDTYCKIYDIMRDVKDPVIEHFQASGRFKRRVYIEGAKQ